MNLQTYKQDLSQKFGCKVEVWALDSTPTCGNCCSHNTDVHYLVLVSMS